MLFVCSPFKCQTVLFDPEIGPYKVLPLQARVDLGVVRWRRTLNSQKFQHYWSLTVWLFSVISRILIGEILPLCKDAVGVFYIHSWFCKALALNNPWRLIYHETRLISFHIALIIPLGKVLFSLQLWENCRAD